MRIREFFDQDERLKTLDKLGDPLQKLEQWVNWKVLGWGIKRWESKKQSKTKGVGGRPAYDSLVIFKMLILQKLYNLSDDQLEYQCKDRLTFTRFLGLALGDSIPDSKTIWNYREMWIKQGVFNKIFWLFNKYRLCPTTVLKNTVIDRTLNKNVRVGLSPVDNSFAHKNNSKKHPMSVSDQGVEGEGFTHCLSSNTNTLSLAT